MGVVCLHLLDGLKDSCALLVRDAEPALDVREAAGDVITTLGQDGAYSRAAQRQRCTRTTARSLSAPAVVTNRLQPGTKR
jgi:hypothetical protein